MVTVGYKWVLRTWTHHPSNQDFCFSECFILKSTKCCSVRSLENSQPSLNLVTRAPEIQNPTKAADLDPFLASSLHRAAWRSSTVTRACHARPPSWSATWCCGRGCRSTRRTARWRRRGRRPGPTRASTSSYRATNHEKDYKSNFQLKSAAFKERNTQIWVSCQTLQRLGLLFCPI